jgi:hypothetical protein
MSLRHLVVALGALSLAVVPAACGEDPAESEQQDVRASYERFVDASAAGDAQAVCSSLVKREQARYVKDAAGKSAEDPRTCEQAFAVLQEDPVIAGLNQDEADDPIQRVEVADDRARVVVSDTDGFPRETELVRRGEVWKVAGAD